jgi:hypothetical protein
VQLTCYLKEKWMKIKKVLSIESPYISRVHIRKKKSKSGRDKPPLTPKPD